MQRQDPHPHPDHPSRPAASPAAWPPPDLAGAPVRPRRRSRLRRLRRQHRHHQADRVQAYGTYAHMQWTANIPTTVIEVSTAVPQQVNGKWRSPARP